MNSEIGIQAIISAAKATAEWTAAGFPTLSPEQFKERQTICAACPEWDSKLFAGIGGCGKCGCGRWKLNMATTECPLKKWRAVEPKQKS